jgi:2-polyprenyl-6-methoxyphenol hydroxylase-like FAD-dependent oxidoreductase
MADFDVIIVGARVAGSTLATLLGEAGHRVLLLDRAHFPSDTLSTHFFRAPALRAFDKIGVRQQVEDTAPKMTIDYNVVDGIAFPEALDEPEDYPYYLCVRRITLDDILTRRAGACQGVNFHQGAIAGSLLWQDGRVIGLEWKENGQTFQASARAVIGADGVRSFLARQVEPEVEHEQPVQRAMYFAYFHRVEPIEGPAAEFLFQGNSLVYCFPTDGDLSLLAVSIPIDDFDEFRSDPEGNLMDALQARATLAPRLHGTERVGPVLGTGSIPCFRRVPFGPGWALVGDAAMTLDPWSGQGIDQATSHSVILAQHLDEFLNEAKDWDQAMTGYHQARNEFSRRAYRQTSTFCEDFRPMTRQALERRGLI